MFIPIVVAVGGAVCLVRCAGWRFWTTHTLIGTHRSQSSNSSGENPKDTDHSGDIEAGNSGEIQNDHATLQHGDLQDSKRDASV